MFRIQKCSCRTSCRLQTVLEMVGGSGVYKSYCLCLSCFKAVIKVRDISLRFGRKLYGTEEGLCCKTTIDRSRAGNLGVMLRVVIATCRTLQTSFPFLPEPRDFWESSTGVWDLFLLQALATCYMWALHCRCNVPLMMSCFDVRLVGERRTVPSTWRAGARLNGF